MWLVLANYLPFNAKIELKLLGSFCIPIFGKAFHFWKKNVSIFGKVFPKMEVFQKWKNTIVCPTDLGAMENAFLSGHR